MNNSQIRMSRISLYMVIILLSFGFSSCSKYLDKTIKADINESDVFTTFDKFQGYVETMYDDIVDPIHMGSNYGEFNNGDDNVCSNKQYWINGDYWYVMGNNNTQYYNTGATRCAGSWSANSAVRQQAIWQNSWFGIRAANQCLAHLDMLVDATDEQKKLIEGQALFFRGYFHWELMKAWGNIPYVDTVFAASEDMRVPQKGLYVTAEKIVADLQKAADLLPEDWDATETGKRTLNQNKIRPCKGMALANMAECLLYCGSPLFNGVETGSYTYNTEYCRRAAEAAWKVIDMTSRGVYALEPWATYKNNFYRKDRKFPWTKEIIFNGPNRGDGRYFLDNFVFGWINEGNFYDAPTQNYIENFEMANGLPIDDPASGFNPMDPWTGRDPRFKYNILIDRDMQVINLAASDSRKYAQLYIGGRERVQTGSLTGFGWKKFWDETLNNWDNGMGNDLYWFSVPKIRLAEVYLMYGEAANEAYGPQGKDPNANLTAVEAVNVVRARAGMPGVNAKFLGSKEAFRERVWAERAVELAYENKRWYDLRRWHVHHLPKYKELYECQFDQNHTYFKKVLYKTIPFAEQHYWLPFPTNQVSLYPEWKQNPGW